MRKLITGLIKECYCNGAHPNETLTVLMQEARPSLACGRSLFTDPPFASTESTTWTAICKLVKIADDLASFCVFM